MTQAINLTVLFIALIYSVLSRSVLDLDHANDCYNERDLRILHSSECPWNSIENYKVKNVEEDDGKMSEKAYMEEDCKCDPKFPSKASVDEFLDKAIQGLDESLKTWKKQFTEAKEDDEEINVEDLPQIPESSNEETNDEEKLSICSCEEIRGEGKMEDKEIKEGKG
eukprot:GAHX01001676.1.p1 GENE.GAHX01001676.1~~GAHX01001676.1.p1  ORF type:complete len:167 (-),score=40.29 GAHX01001676.1:134-634(-)